MNFLNYNPEQYFDEYFYDIKKPRTEASLLISSINKLPKGDLKRKQIASNKALYNMGITFRLYAQSENQERTIPFDIIPRIINGEEWNPIEKGLKQRISAINMFIDDLQITFI